MTASINVWKEGNIRTKERHWESASRGTMRNMVCIWIDHIPLHRIISHIPLSHSIPVQQHDYTWDWRLDTPKDDTNTFSRNIYLFGNYFQGWCKKHQWIHRDFHWTAHPVTMKDALRASFWTCTKMPALAWQNWQSTLREPGKNSDVRWKFKGKLGQACTTSRISPYSTRLRPYCSNLAGKHHGDPQGSSITSSNIQWIMGWK